MSALLLAALFAQASEPPKARRTEFGILPAFALNSDVGVGVGFVANAARFDPNYDPYRVRVFGRFFLFVRESPEGPPEVALHAHVLRFELPGLANGRLRVDWEVRIRRNSIAGYSGYGNASVHARPWEEVDREVDPDGYARVRRRNWHDRWFPALRSSFRGSLAPQLQLYGTVDATYNRIAVYPDSRLADDLEGASGGWVRDHLFGLQPHVKFNVEVGLLYDGRDSEHDPTVGVRLEGAVRGGGGVGPEVTARDPVSSGGAFCDVRGFVPIAGDSLVLGVHAAADLLFGAVPLYELSSTGGLQPIAPFGGGRSIRGAPPERWHGKIKLIANVELRSTFLRFAIRDQRFRVGALLFADVGRVWADYRPRPRLDGEGPGLKLGLGGGLRIRWGETFVLRIDGAWSPGNAALYFDVGHVF